ncbi:glycosyltransferase family 4 protein [Dehalococcoidia bacterium]|nr:glycosyltransferase family 4 protein [Dehalococcoidia bacterium]
MKLSICMLAPEFPPECAGIGNYIYSLSEKLAELGHTITVITRGSWRQPKVEDMDGIKVYRELFIPIYPFHVKLHGVFVNRLLKSIGDGFDVIHSHSPLIPVSRCNIPHVLTFHTCCKQEARAFTEVKDLYSLYMRTLVRFHIQNEFDCIKQATKTTSVSSGVAKELTEYGLNSDVVSVIGNGVNTDLFTPRYERQEARILYTGRLVYRKGVIDLVKSAEYVCKQHPDTTFTVIGDGPLRPTLEKMVHQLKLEGKFSFLGSLLRKELIQYYQNETICVLPSYYEGLPTTILEAMSCGMPVVATNISGSADAVINGETGFLVPPGEPKLLADSIMRLLTDKDLRLKMGQAARERVEKQFTWDIIAERILAVYKDVL